MIIIANNLNMLVCGQLFTAQCKVGDEYGGAKMGFSKNFNTYFSILKYCIFLNCVLQEDKQANIVQSIFSISPFLSK